MRYDFYAKMIKFLFQGVIYDLLQEKEPSLVNSRYKKRVSHEYKSIIERTEGIGGIKENPMEFILLFTALTLGFYKAAEGKISEELFSEMVYALSYSKRMKMLNKANGAFSDKTIGLQKKLDAFSKTNNYKNQWDSDFEYVEGSGELFLTYTKCGICAVTKQEGVPQLAKYLCKMDYSAFDVKGAVLDRTKTLASGDDCCNFHVMSKEKAKEIGFKPSDNAK